MATLLLPDTLDTMPINPSGATTGLNTPHPAATRTQEQCASVHGLGLMQHLGRDVAGIELAAEPQQLPQPLVLRAERGRNCER